MIRCGHCGDSHATVADVRACSGSADPLVEQARRDHAANHANPAAAPGVELAPEWERLAGPEALGRSVIVDVDGWVPDPWSTAPRVRVDAASVDASTLELLQDAWSSRTRLVIELDGALADLEWIEPDDFWLLGPGHERVGERLAHLVTANSVDARRPQSPVFAPVDLAIASGAILASGPGRRVVADVAGPGGEALWCDGGPLDWRCGLDLDAPVVPLAHLERGLLRPIHGREPGAELAPDQLEAVRHVGGGARIIAPAGSGKTRVLTERARHLVNDVGIDPASICLVAFNVRARDEMVERTADIEGVEVRTLNSLALAVVRGSGPFRTPSHRRPPRVVDEREVRRMLSDLVRTGRSAMTDPFAVWIEALSACRLGLRSPAEVERDFGGDVPGFAEVFSSFRGELRARDAVDFDEQILGAIEILLTDPAARRSARRACRLMLVDEFQDLTPAHVLLIRLLAGPTAEVFGVGDDDQTIYGYAGASPQWLIDFSELFPGAGHHDLRVNYRCRGEVVAAATNLLSHNRRRIDKSVTAGGVGSPTTRPAIEVRRSTDLVTDVTAHVTELVSAGERLASIAVLTRVNATLLAPMLALDAAGIATNSPLGPEFLERTGVAGALAWLRLATAPEQRLPGDAIDIAARRPPRALSRRLVGWMAEQSSPRGLRQLAGRLREQRDRTKVEGFVADVIAMRERRSAGATTRELLEAVRDDTGLGRALDDRLDASRRAVDRSTHGDDLAALISVAALQPDAEEFPRWLAERLGSSEPNRRGVRLSTVHRVKGREWPHVVVYDFSAGVMPHRLASDIEEERRIAHVAITRASESLLVLAADPVSPFVAQLATARDPTTPDDLDRASMADEEPGSRSRADRPQRPRPTAAASVHEAGLRERLRSWRLERSRTDGVPAYVVFADTTLYELAARRPETPQDLLSVSGMGPTKVERYGESILELIARDGVAD